jgi:4-hydroxymandelate oxidase
MLGLDIAASGATTAKQAVRDILVEDIGVGRRARYTATAARQGSRGTATPGDWIIRQSGRTRMNAHNLTRRGALGAAGAMLAGTLGRSAPAPASMPPSSAMEGQAAHGGVLAPRAELVNTLEYEEQAKRNLAPAVFAQIAGGARESFDRITLRHRLLVPVLEMDLGVTLFGDRLFAPIVVGPIADQRRFHADGELATARGASAAKAVMVVSSRSSVPLQEIAAEAGLTLWYQVFAGDRAAGAQIQHAVANRCRAICVTVGVAPPTGGTRRAATVTSVDWAAVAALKRTSKVPVMVKGVATPEAAQLALQQGVDGIVVSNYGGVPGPQTEALILVLPKIVDVVAGRVPVLVDGGFRRGTDILKALALGAKSVLVGRPAMWGLAAYGADGVQGVVEMLQTELARYMGMCGKSTLQMLDGTLLKVHGVPVNKAPSRGSASRAGRSGFEGASRG